MTKNGKDHLSQTQQKFRTVSFGPVIFSHRVCPPTSSGEQTKKNSYLLLLTVCDKNSPDSCNAAVSFGARMNPLSTIRRKNVR